MLRIQDYIVCWIALTSWYCVIPFKLGNCSIYARQVAELGEAEIHLLAVYLEVRRQGIASRLIKACEEQAVSFGYSKMVLSTQQTMKEAQRIYEQLDYRRNSTRDWSKGGSKIYFVYEKILQT